MFLIVSCHESRKSMRLARNRRRSNYDCLTVTDCLKVMVVVGEPQQFSMFGRKIPCETIVSGRLKYADAGLNDLIGLSIIDILLASPKGFDPYVGNQKFTTLLIE